MISGQLDRMSGKSTRRLMIASELAGILRRSVLFGRF